MSLERIRARLISLRNAIFRRDRLDRELDDEIDGTIEILTRRFADAGISPSAAREAAVRELGGPGGILRLKADVRDGRIGGRLDAFRL